KHTDKKRKQPPSDGSGWGDHIQLLQIYELWDQTDYSTDWVKDNNLQVRGMLFVKNERKQLCQIMQKFAKGYVQQQKRYPKKTVMHRSLDVRRKQASMTKDDKQDDTSNNTSVRELGNVSLQCPKLTEVNYTTWALMMETILKAYGIWETIVAKGVITNEKKENTSKAIIFQTLPQDILMQVAQYSTAKEVWDSIKVKHLGADLVQKARLQTLRSELETLRIKPNEKVSDFEGKLSSIMAKFKGLGETLEDKVLVRKLLNSVPKKFLPIVATIEQYQDLDEMSFEEAVGRLTAYEERIKSQDTLEANDQDKLLMASSNNKRYGKWRDKNFNEEGKESMKWKNNPNARRASTSQGTKDKSKLRCYDCANQDIATSDAIKLAKEVDPSVPSKVSWSLSHTAFGVSKSIMESNHSAKYASTSLSEHVTPSSRSSKSSRSDHRHSRRDSTEYRDRSEPSPRHGRDYRDYDNKRSGYESSRRTPGIAHLQIGGYFGGNNV
ncbi:hypothetical protein Tco_0543738, partial [Tanacetum coccineum]